MENVKPLLEWVHENGEAKAVDRVLMKSLPELLKFGVKIKSNEIANFSEISIPEELFYKLSQIAENVVGKKYV